MKVSSARVECPTVRTRGALSELRSLTIDGIRRLSDIASALLLAGKFPERPRLGVVVIPHGMHGESRDASHRDNPIAARLTPLMVKNQGLRTGARPPARAAEGCGKSRALAESSNWAVRAESPFDSIAPPPPILLLNPQWNAVSWVTYIL